MNIDNPVNPTKSYSLLHDYPNKTKQDKTEWEKNGLYNLLKHQADIEIYIENKDPDTSKANDGWSYIKWTTCFADFKKRKFKCKDINYNNDTGVVDKIEFEEIK